MPTQPGTEIKVTPERESPNMPNATTYHGEFLFPRKYPSLFTFRDVIHAIPNKRRKYPSMEETIKVEDIDSILMREMCKDTCLNLIFKLTINNYERMMEY